MLISGTYLVAYNILPLVLLLGLDADRSVMRPVGAGKQMDIETLTMRLQVPPKDENEARERFD